MKSRILITTAWYLPGHLGGGPIRTISNLVDWLGDEFDFYIVTSDRDFKDTESYKNVRLDDWNQVGKTKVFYATAKTLKFSGLARIFRETPHDLLYLNSLFDPKFTLLLLLLKKMNRVPDVPVLLAPRGEFSAGALRIKTWKKRSFLYLARVAGLYRHIHWHASTVHEAADICKKMPEMKERIHVAIDLASRFKLALPNKSRFTDGSDLRVCFLSRISPMKNLDFALRVLAGLKTPILFDIYGPIEDLPYWQACEKLINVLPKNIHVNYKGIVPSEQVGNVISSYNLFFVPSRGENYGHVFVESWLAGVPVLVSDQTPWRDLSDRQLGWDIPLNQPNAFAQMIGLVADMKSAEWQVLSDACLKFSQSIIDDKRTIDANRTMFNYCMGIKRVV